MPPVYPLEHSRLGAFWALFPASAFRRAARIVLGSAYSPAAVDAIDGRTRVVHSTVVRSRRPHSLGLDFLLRYFEWDGALHQALREAGSAIEVINGMIFRPYTRTAFRISRLRSPVRIERERWIYDTMFRFVTTAPFKRRVLPVKTAVAFDVTRCPFAKFFHQQGVTGLTRYAACRLDNRMAQPWRINLTRPPTIAQGDSHSDFRFADRAEVSVADPLPGRSTAP